jgi:hypothetical protein
VTASIKLSTAYLDSKNIDTACSAFKAAARQFEAALKIPERSALRFFSPLIISMRSGIRPPARIAYILQTSLNKAILSKLSKKTAYFEGELSK